MHGLAPGAAFLGSSALLRKFASFIGAKLQKSNARPRLAVHSHNEHALSRKLAVNP